MQVNVMYHGNCFDGCASAAVFGRYAQEKLGAAKDDIRYQPLKHRQGGPFAGVSFEADVTACLDLPYHALFHWWFDNHHTPFRLPGDRYAFQRDLMRSQKFWDPTVASCTGLLVRTLTGRFGWSAGAFAELVRWADVVGASRFDSARAALSLEEPALRAMALLEGTKDAEVPTRLIEAMQRSTLAEIAEEGWFGTALVPVVEERVAVAKEIRDRAQASDGVVAIDLGDTPFEVASRYLPFDLVPEARYAVMLVCDPQRARLSVGSNPWAEGERSQDLARLCARHDGGGRPGDSAVMFPREQLAEARRVFAEIAGTLREARTS
ncbi:MAG TPA: phosphoesterase [Anaeromyxobacteraceae bacterium]|nr:phosphoesterase [Anaeromyxobacteraceae bacterium]